MANRKLYEAIIAISAQTKGSFSSTFGKARAELQVLDEQMHTLQRTQADISSYKKLDAAISETDAKLKSYERQHEIVQNAIRGTEKPSVNLQLQNEKLEESIRKTRDALDLQQMKLDKTSERLKAAGINTEELDKASAALGEEMDTLRAKQQAYADSVEQTARPLNTFGTLLTSAAVLGGFKKFAGGTKEATDASMEFETAMAGVQRTVGGSSGFTAGLGENFRQLSTLIPLTAGELAGIAETAGQLGIAQSNVETFTAVMGKLGTATDLSAPDAATMLAQFSNVTGTSDYERLGAAVAALGDSTATTASKIVQMSQGLAASATTAGLSETDILGISAAVGSLGIEAEAGSTAMSTLISTLHKAVETGDGLSDFASVAGMSAETFRKAWAEDAAGALDAFISGLDNVEHNGKSAVALLDELGITNVRQTKAILGLSAAGDLLGNSIRLANSAWAENTALNEKASVMYNTTQAKLTMLQNQYGNLKIAVGDSLTPALGGLYDTANDVLGSVTAFVGKNPELVRTLTVTATAVGGVATAVTVYNTAARAASLIGFAIPAIPAGAAGAIIGIAGAIGLVGSALYNAKEAYEEMIPPVDSLTEKAQALRETMADGRAAAEDAAASALASASVAGRYVDELERLEEAGLDSEDAQRRYHAALELLCQTVPELSQYVDLQTGSIEGGTAALREHTEALVNDAKTAAYQETITEFYAAQNDAIKEQAKHEIELDMERQKGVELEKKLRLQMEAAAYVQERINQEQIDELGNTWDLERQYNSYMESIEATNRELDDSNKRQKNLKEAIQQGAAATAEAEAQIRYAENTMRSLGLVTNDTAAAFETASDAPVDFSESINKALDAAKTDLETLSAAYTNAYDAAYQSIHGQFALWDEVAKLEPLSIDTLLQNKEGQNAYWQSYQDNITLLEGYTDKIQGLDSMLASLEAGGGGDAKLVNTIAGIASAVNAGDEGVGKVERLIAAYQKGDEIEGNLSGSIRDLQVDLDEGIDAIERTMQEGIEKLNLSDEARQAALNTIDAYAEELDAGNAVVAAAMERIFATARGAVPGGPLPVFSNYTAATLQQMNGYATGTNNAERGWKLVGEEGPELMFFHGGETVLNNRETREWLSRPAPVLPVSAGGLPANALLSPDADRLSLPEIPAVSIPNMPDFKMPDIPALTISDEPAQETRGPGGSIRFMLDNGSLPAAGSPDASGNADGGGIVVNLNTNVQIEGNADQDTVERMRRLPEDWAEYILDVIEKDRRDRERTRFSR